MSIFLILTLDTQLETGNLNDVAKTMDLPIVFERSVDLSSHSGFLPATVNGVKSGVEMFRLSFEDVSALLPPNKDLNPERPLVLQFRWDGGSHDALVALYTAMLYLSNFNGIAFDFTSNQYLSIDELEQSAAAILGPTG